MIRFFKELYLTAFTIELDTPTKARGMPMKNKRLSRLASQARHKSVAQHTLFASRTVVSVMNATQGSEVHLHPLNIPQLARLGLFSRSTQGRGLADLFHSSPPGSLSVRDATVPAM